MTEVWNPFDDGNPVYKELAKQTAINRKTWRIVGSIAAAMLIADMTEQYAQTLEPQEEQQDPLVAIRQQELQLKAADLNRKSQEFEVKQGLEADRDAMDAQLANRRIELQEEALADKTRVAEDRVQTQRDIAALNARMKGTG